MPDIELYKAADESAQAFNRFKSRLRQEGLKLRGDTDYRNIENLSPTALVLQEHWIAAMDKTDRLAAQHPAQGGLFDGDKPKADTKPVETKPYHSGHEAEPPEKEEVGGVPKTLAWVLQKVRQGFITHVQPCALAPKSFAALHVSTGVELAEDGALVLTDALVDVLGESAHEVSGVTFYEAPEGAQIDGFEEPEADQYDDLVALVAGRPPKNVVQFEYDGQAATASIYDKPKKGFKGWLYVVTSVDSKLAALVTSEEMKEETPMGKSIALLDALKKELAG